MRQLTCGVHLAAYPPPLLLLVRSAARPAPRSPSWRKKKDTSRCRAALSASRRCATGSRSTARAKALHAGPLLLQPARPSAVVQASHYRHGWGLELALCRHGRGRSSPCAAMAGSRSSPRCAPRQPAAPLLCCCSSPLHAMAHARPRLTCTPRPAALLRPRLARHLCLARGRGRCALDVGRTPSAFSVPWEPVSRANMLSWARPNPMNSDPNTHKIGSNPLGSSVQTHAKSSLLEVERKKLIKQ